MTLRLAHRLMKGHYPGRWGTDEAARLADDAIKDIKDAVVVVANDVHDFIMSHVREKGPFSIKMLPKLTPQFPLVWVEYESPAIGQLGTVVRTHECDPPLEVQGLFAKWLVSMRCFLAETQHGMKESFCEPTYALAIAEDGSYVTNIFRWPEGHQCPESLMQATEKDVAMIAAVACAAFAFMHCKNVELSEAQEHSPPAKWLRRFRLPKLTYKTLRIAPMAAIVRKHAAETGQPLDKAMHICRGHFRTYDESSKGLFGKYHGTFWVPHHVRGNMAAGSVVKQYEVAQPKGV